jgi:hypothetical protein
LPKRIQHHNHGFEHLYFRAIKDHILVDGRTDAEEAAWLREVLLATGRSSTRSGSSCTNSGWRPGR